LHTYLCRHATGAPADLAAAAVRLGLTEIGFADHAPMPRDDWDDWRMSRSELVSYVDQVQQARQAFPQLTIRLGLEVDYLPGLEGWIRDLASLPVWDYLIGSVHYVFQDWNFDHPDARAEWQRRDPWEIWTDYFHRLTQAAASGLFDIIAHADLCKKFRFYPSQDWTSLALQFLEAAKANGVALELNTAGLRKECQEIYPGPKLLAMAQQLGLPITFGSDAHSPEELGAGFDQALAQARAVGYRHWCRFTGRQHQLVPL